MEENNNNNTTTEESSTHTINTTPYSDSALPEVVSLVKEGSGKYTPGRMGGQEGENVITNITLHIVAADWDSNSLSGWSRWGQASSHYGIASDGTIVQLVNEKDTAWTNGGSGQTTIENPVGEGRVGFNNNSVTIEIANLTAPNSYGEGTITATNGQEYHYKDGKVEMNGQYYTYPITNEALDSTIRLVADIAKRNNLGELYHDGYTGTLTWHRDFPDVYKPCPGDYVIAMTDYICESANMINEKGYYIPDYAIESDSALMGVVLSTESNPFETGTVASDMYLAVSSINNIRNAMGNVEVQSASYNSTSTIPANLMNAETSLLGISSNLNTTIHNETKVISSIAQVFYDMDRERTAAANALSDGSELVFDESGYTEVLNQLVSTDVTSELNFESFMFNPFSHTEGNSGKLCLSDINSMLSGGSLTGPLHENLENERVSARNTKTEIDNLTTLISSGTSFQGDVWKQVSQRLSDYSDLMTTRIESADILEKAIVDALTLIKDYMGDYDELDDSKLPELRERVEQIKQDIVESQQIIDATHTVAKTYEDETGATKYYYVTEYVYSVGARNAAKQFITQATSTLREIELEIVKLEGLPIILAEAEQIVNDALTQIYGKYGAQASSAISGNEVSYIPPANTTYTAPKLPSYTPWIYQKDTPEGKVSAEEFYMDLDLRAQYGDSYNDYLNGVTKENNPMYNEQMEDNGIEPGESLEDTTTDDTVEEPSEETEDNTDDNDTEEVPDGDQTNEEPSQPETPSEPTQPETPSEPTQPETPSEPTQPETPSEPTQPETPSEPTQPETPSEPTQPETPSEPTQPETPSEPTQPETPSEPTQPETPSEPTKPVVPANPETPSEQAKPSTPTTPSVPEDSGDAGYTDTPITPDDGNLDVDNNTDNMQDIPPIVEIPDVDDNENEIIDITPTIDDNTLNENDNAKDIIKTVGIISGVGAAVGAAALGAHTVSKKKEYDYED